jgi:hypothetical protein
MAKLYALMIMLVVLAACGPGPTEPSDFEFGRIDVYVRDGSGQPVDGATVRLERLNGQVEDAGGLSGSVGLPGYFFFLRTSGEFRVAVTPPAGYEFAAGQEGSTRITFRRNELQTINFVLRRI